MDHMHFKCFKVYFPKWVVAYFSFAGTITLFFSLFILWMIITKNPIITKIFDGTIWGSLTIGIFLGSLTVGIIFIFFKVLYYSITVTKHGLESKNIMGKKQVFKWSDIIDLQGPRFGIPSDFLYVVSKNKDKLLLVKSMKNHKRLIKTIQDRATNLHCGGS